MTGNSHIKNCIVVMCDAYTRECMISTASACTHTIVTFCSLSEVQTDRDFVALTHHSVLKIQAVSCRLQYWLRLTTWAAVC